MPLAAQRVPMLFVGLLSIACGMWLGLVRLGWNLSLPWPDQLIAHGPLMVCGFLGTLISLERAVALGSRWGYAAPVLVAAGALMLDLGPLGAFGPMLITGGSFVMVAIFVVVWRRRASLSIATMATGALAWTAGNVQWLGGAPMCRVVFWWLAFLVLTIAGERLELNRVLRPTRAVRSAFIVAMVTVLGGVVAATWWPEPGVRALGVGLLALTWWLARHDVARRAVHQRGVTRFMAVCLLGGYVWLGVGGAIAAFTGVAMPGLLYDAMLHAVFLGFVISMVFAHAPVIFSAVLGLPLEYRPAFYLHVGALHVSLILRVVGDLVDSLGRWRVWGGLLNAVALLVFLLNTGRSMALRGNHGDPI
ncbi:MAG: hypothetical protein A3F70_04460 [Acidobacteria bacterium RIFCSPLOWO2_12_FULL_67_14]|nr:MAG: hypothetical protein A3F70_04460 [Acidobacteria bacterium RIFCSPLOWO2_12_FULL_67_14]